MTVLELLLQTEFDMKNLNVCLKLRNFSLGLRCVIRCRGLQGLKLVLELLEESLELVEVGRR